MPGLVGMQRIVRTTNLKNRQCPHLFIFSDHMIDCIYYSANFYISNRCQLTVVIDVYVLN